MKNVLTLAVLAGLLFAVPAVADAKTVRLADAVAQRLVSVSADAPDGLASVSLSIQNLTARALVIDTVGSQVTPDEGQDYQRLALAFTISTDTSNLGLIDLAPRAEWSGDVQTCCRDSAREAPMGIAEYEIATRLVNPYELAVMSYWRQHPELSQGLVNEAIWGNTSLSSLKQTVAASAAKPSSGETDLSFTAPTSVRANLAAAARESARTRDDD